MTPFALPSPMVVRCRTCEVPLTNPLVPLPDVKMTCYEDGQAFLPQGYYCVADGDYRPAGSLVINLNDLVNTGHFPDGRGLNGCCGPSGDTINRLCCEGHGVGTEFADCWMPHSFEFASDAVLFWHDLPVPVPTDWRVWNGGTARRIARSMRRQNGRYDALPILADALEEGGCTDAAILSHCRSGLEHQRGCWVRDLILGRSRFPA
jgi:hypothetical protein